MYTLPGKHEGGGWKSACCFEVWHIPTFPVMHVQKEGVNMNKFLSLNPRFLYYLKTAVY